MGFRLVCTVTRRTQDRLLGPFGKKSDVWAHCIFVDPIADLAFAWLIEPRER
jgi:hypothetical protein